MANKFCPKCSKNLPEGAEFCPKCGAKVKEIAKTSPRIENFSVSEVILSEMLANVRIAPIEGSYVRVTVEGDEETKQATKLEASGQSLKISAPIPFDDRQQSGFGYSEGSFVGGNVVISSTMMGTGSVNGQLIVNGRHVDMKRIIRITVEVPLETTVKVGKLLGKADIGDTEGDLIINISGITNIKAGKVKNLNISAGGATDIDVAAVDGNIDVRLSGAGNVRISGGKAHTFYVSVSGAGDVTFNGTADMAEMHVSGAGDIYLNECLSAPHKHQSGCGSIRVGHAPKATDSSTNW